MRYRVPKKMIVGSLILSFAVAIPVANWITAHFGFENEQLWRAIYYFSVSGLYVLLGLVGTLIFAIIKEWKDRE